MSDNLEVVYRLDIEPEDMPVRGAFASGDADEDSLLEDQIIARLDRGDIEAWCYVKITATLEVSGQTFKGWAGIGGISYDSERALRKELYEDDSHGLKGEALDDLKRTLSEASDRGIVARKALKALEAR